MNRNYRQIAQDILTQIVGGEVVEQHNHVKGMPCKLGNSHVECIIEIEGVTKGSEHVFVKDQDYRMRGDSVEWIAGGKNPDDGSQFSVKYVFSGKSGITDLSPGSVVRTIVEAVSREIEYLYIQVNQAYLGGFLETASGSSLDLVVSVLGLSRKPPQPSNGFVTFGRNSESEVLAVNGEAVLYEEAIDYSLKKPLVKEIVKIDGVCNGADAVFENGVDYELAEKSVRWLPDGKKPDRGTVFHVDYSVYREIKIPKETNVATFSMRPEDVRVFTTTMEQCLALNREGKWEVDVPVACTTPGAEGNVLAGSVTVMPQPIGGVEYVINKADIASGLEAEGDDELRLRARHALEFAGKATLPSLESAIRSVEGVHSLLIEDRPQDLPGIVRVIVDGGDMDKILSVVNETRAAGVKVEVLRPKIVHISTSLTLRLEESVSASSASSEVEKEIRSYISSLDIGEDVLHARIIEAALRGNGVVDVRDVALTAQKVEGMPISSDMENIEISNEERAEPRNVNISVEGGIV